MGTVYIFRSERPPIMLVPGKMYTVPIFGG